MTAEEPGDQDSSYSSADARCADARCADPQDAVAADGPPDSAEAATEADAESAGPGPVLRRARTALGCSQEEIADGLNLANRVVEALEADDFQRLPPPAFTRGYLRSYARMVHVEPEDVVARYQAHIRDDNPFLNTSPLAKTRPVRHFIQTHPGLVLGALIVLMVGLAGCAAYYAWERVGDARSASTPAPAGRTGSGALDSLPASGGPGAVQSSTRATAASWGDDGPSLERAVSRGASGSKVAVHREVSDDGRRVTIRAGGEDQLSLAFDGASWVRIHDAGSVDLLRTLKRAGERVNIYGRAPFEVVVANASAATLDYNQRSVSLEPHTRNEVARLVIGP